MICKNINNNLITINGITNLKKKKKKKFKLAFLLARYDIAMSQLLSPSPLHAVFI